MRRFEKRGRGPVIEYPLFLIGLLVGTARASRSYGLQAVLDDLADKIAVARQACAQTVAWGDAALLH